MWKKFFGGKKIWGKTFWGKKFAGESFIVIGSAVSEKLAINVSVIIIMTRSINRYN